MRLLKLSHVLLLCAVLGLTACKQPAEHAPPRAVFNLAGSDAKAVALAEEVVQACGGRENWEKTRYVTWRLFNKRLQVWDKTTGNLRVESRRSLVLMNLNTMTGRAWKLDDELTEPEELRRAIQYGYEAFINDSYWMFMPFKLKDPGVTLKYLGVQLAPDSSTAEVISVTFQGVGVTPNNKYHVFIDPRTKLVTYWKYFMDATDPAPRFSTPWRDYQKHGNILLASDRGQKKNTGLAVFEHMPASVFESPAPIDWEALNAENFSKDELSEDDEE